MKRIVQGALIPLLLTVSACGAGGGGLSVDQAQAYTCGQWDKTPASESDAQHEDEQAKVVDGLLKAHGYGMTPANEVRLKGEIDAQLAGNAMYDGRDCDDKTAKLDDLLDWASIKGLTQ